MLSLLGINQGIVVRNFFIEGRAIALLLFTHHFFVTMPIHFEPICQWYQVIAVLVYTRKQEMLTSDRPMAAALKNTLKLVSNSHLRVILTQKPQQKDIDLSRIGGIDVYHWEPTETLRREAGWDSESPRILDHTDM